MSDGPTESDAAKFINDVIRALETLQRLCEQHEARIRQLERWQGGVAVDASGALCVAPAIEDRGYARLMENERT